MHDRIIELWRKQRPLDMIAAEIGWTIEATAAVIDVWIDKTNAESV